ncbi:MAG TPA: hypothetical protein VM487_24860 [Phycisphaerae bacterium]|nr:hypothetical protein [Phycisphaerae bacterium]
MRTFDLPLPYGRGSVGMLDPHEQLSAAKTPHEQAALQRDTEQRGPLADKPPVAPAPAD